MEFECNERVTPCTSLFQLVRWRGRPFCLALFGSPASTQCPVQTYTPQSGNGLEITAIQSVAQTFTLPDGGRLDGLDLIGVGHHQGVSTDPLEISLLATDATGTPTIVLHNVVLPPSAIPTASATVHVDLPLLALIFPPGTVLGIHLETDATGPNYVWAGDVPGGYSGGAAFIRATIATPWDMGFRAYLRSPPSTATFGTPLAGSLGPPALTVSGLPVLGSTVRILLGNSQSGPAPGALILGQRRTFVPTVFGGTLLVEPLVTLRTLVPMTLALDVPNDPSLCGASLLLQQLVSDPGAIHGVSFSSALALNFEA